jgi:hypothetical protein
MVWGVLGQPGAHMRRRSKSWGIRGYRGVTSLSRHRRESDNPCLAECGPVGRCRPHRLEKRLHTPADQVFSEVSDFAVLLRELHAERRGRVISGRNSRIPRAALTRADRGGPPLLITRISISGQPAGRLSRPSSEARSATTATTGAPEIRLISSATAFRRASSRPLITTSQSSRAKAAA